MTLANDRNKPRRVIVLGPAPDRVGGMATVVDQMLAMDFSGRYVCELLANTFAPPGGQTLAGRLARHARHLQRLRQTVNTTGARLVHIHTCSGAGFYRSAADMLVARHAGARVILHVHGAAFDRFAASEPRWRRRLIGRALSQADMVLALSVRWQDTLSTLAPRAVVRVVENAVAVPVAPPRPAHDNRSRPGHDGPCRFVFLARLDDWKGVDDLLDASEILHERGVSFSVTLAGPPGTAGDAVVLDEKIRARRLGGKVRYIGTVQGADKTALLAGADAFVLPSHHEGMPIALLEALAAGLPAVATRVGAVPEIIEHGRQGFLVPPRQPRLLADAMGTLATDAPCRKSMAANAYELAAARFSLARLERDFCTLYDAILPAPAALSLGSPPVPRSSDATLTFEGIGQAASASSVSTATVL